MPKILHIRRTEHNCDMYGQKGYQEPEITSGIIYLSEDLNEFEKLLNEKGHLELRIEDSHYDCNDFLKLRYDERFKEVDSESLYDILCDTGLQELVEGTFDYSLALDMCFSE